MLEGLRHLLGVCGEPHPSLLTLIYGAPVLSYIAYRIKNYGKDKNVKRVKRGKDIRV